MAEKRRCDGCGKEYWWPGARWQHEGCVVPVEVVGVVEPADAGVFREEQPGDLGRKQRWSRKDYNAYQREYMRKRRHGE